MIIVKMFFLFLFPALLFFTSAGVNIYITCRDLDKILDGFKGSVIVSSYGDIWGRGSLFAKCTLVSILAGGLVFPNRHIRNGTLDREELARLSGAIKLRMKLYIGLLVSAASCFFLTAIVLAILK